MSKILRYLACLFMLIFAGNALAAGYSCPSYKKYTSCASGYYMTSSSSSTVCNTTAKAGNACRPCSVMGSNYTCSGGTACPKLNRVTCSAGYYLKANATSCSACGGNNYYCPGETYNVSSSAQGRNTVSSGYYSTGGTSTTRTGQSACGGNNYYCSAGVRYTVSSGYYSTGGTSTTRTGQSQCTGATYCASGVRNSCPGSYTANTTAGKTSASQCQISVSAGKYIATANSSTQSTCAAGRYKAAHTVNYGSTSSCSTCGAGTYSSSGAASCTACSGSTQYQNLTGQSSCKTVSAGYYKSSNSAQTQCPSGYRDGAGAANINGCEMDVDAGHYVATANSSTQSTCAGGRYKAAHTVKYGSTSSCSTCGVGTYSSSGAASCTACSGSTQYQNLTGQSSCKTVSSGYYKSSNSAQTQCPANYRDGTGAANINACKTSCAGGTYVATANAACTSVGTGYYRAAHTVNYGSTSTRSQCPANYRDGAAASAQNGCKTSCAGGTYVATANAACTSVGTGYYKGAHTVNYGSTSTRSQCPSGYRDGAGAANVNGCEMDVDAGHYVATANSSTQSTCAGGRYKAAHTVKYGSTSSCSTCGVGTYSSSGAASCTACSGSTQYQNETGQTSCKTVSSGYYKSSNSAQAQCPSGYRDGAGAANQNSCVGSFTKTGSQQTPSMQTGCVARTLGTCTPGTCTYTKQYSGTIVSDCTPTNCTKPQTCTSADDNYYLSGGSAAKCSSSYPYSDGGNISSSYCYKYGTKTGSQVNGSVPTNCASVTSWNSCTPGTCQYKDYNGATDGTCTPSNCTKTPAAVTAKAGYYDAGTTCSACPSGYPNSDDDNEGGITKCYSNTKSRPWGGGQISCATPTGCSDSTCNTCTLPACSYVAYSNSTGSADGTIKSGCSTNSEDCQQTVKSVTAKAGRYVSGITCPACAVGTFQDADDSTATSCSVCAANTYAASTGMSACTACPSGYSTSGTAASNHDAKSDCSITCAAGTRVVTADAACTTPTGSWYTASHSVAAGSTTPAATVKACLTNYSTPNTTTRTDHDASTDCKISCAAGTRVATENATSCTTPAGNWYVGAHSVAQGSISSYSNCLTNYTISGTAAANHDTASDCKISCGGGSYIATANNTTCSDVGAGYWAAASTVSQGSAGVRNACDDGLTTIGSGAGADEVGDCGRVLNVNGEKIYLRSERKTTPSLNVSINGTTFYGNMGASGIGALKLNSGGTTYSVYDDSME